MNDEDFKSRIKYTEKRKSELIDFIMAPMKREMSKEEIEKYLSLDINEIPEGVLQVVQQFIKEQFEKGKVDYKTYDKYINHEQKNIEKRRKI